MSSKVHLNNNNRDVTRTLEMFTINIIHKIYLYIH